MSLAGRRNAGALYERIHVISSSALRGENAVRDKGKVMTVVTGFIGGRSGTLRLQGGVVGRDVSCWIPV